MRISPIQYTWSGDFAIAYQTVGDGPSEVLVSRPVKDLVAGSEPPFDDRGEHGLKGAPDRWRY